MHGNCSCRTTWFARLQISGNIEKPEELFSVRALILHADQATGRLLQHIVMPFLDLQGIPRDFPYLNNSMTSFAPLPSLAVRRPYYDLRRSPFLSRVNQHVSLTVKGLEAPPTSSSIPQSYDPIDGQNG
jgi:hypothetical protein